MILRTNSEDALARILLCDDSPIERLALGHFLRHEGYAVDEVGDGASAIRYLQNRAIDLLLLDLQMPDVDGFDVLAYAQQHLQALPVILLSGMAANEIQHKMSDLPSRELPPLMLKPINTSQLLDLVALQLSGQLP